ncbi:MAG TPA: hypothetical protein VFU63_04015 [Ktedonobacterales bacterium]|nr:hypothetical protein [Ktedonobacterales bacterium]
MVLLVHNILPTPNSTGVSTGPLVLDLTQVQLTCIHDFAWSPDSQTVAALGYQSQCASDGPASYVYEPGLLAIYSANTGKLRNLIHPDDLITPALHLQPPLIATPPVGSHRVDTSKQSVEYNHLLWSPDGRLLALPFLVRVAARSNGQPVADVTRTSGILLIGADGKNTRTFTHKLLPDKIDSGRWNTSTGDYLPVPTGTTETTSPDLSPALSYRWASDGTLVPQTPLTISGTPVAEPLSSIGNPDGSDTFSLWQPARIGPLNVNLGGRSVTVPDVYVFVSEFAAWSPDGQFFTEHASISGLLGDIRNVAPEIREQIGPVPTIPIRDKGLAEVLSRISPFSPEYYAAWSHSGLLLATETVGNGPDGNPDPKTMTVSIIDCGSGHTVAALHPASTRGSTTNARPSGNTASEFSATFLRWSPHDAQLLVYDSAVGTLMIFDSSHLP